MSREQELLYLIEPKKIDYILNIKENSKVLILAPHADDEAIGCAGMISSLIKEFNCEVNVVLISNTSSQRLKEMKEAQKVLGYKELFIVPSLKRGALENYIITKSYLCKLINSIMPDIVFTPFVFDFVEDHFRTNLYLKSALEHAVIGEIQICLYEIWNLITYPNLYIDVTSYKSIKECVLSCYMTQEKKYKISRKAKVVNDLRYEMMFRKKSSDLECFLKIDKKKYLQILDYMIS